MGWGGGGMVQPCQPREPNAGKSGNISCRFPIEIYSSFSRSSFIFATAVNRGSDGCTAITHLIETNAIVTDEKKEKKKKTLTKCLTM